MKRKHHLKDFAIVFVCRLLNVAVSNSPDTAWNEWLRVHGFELTWMEVVVV
jgi:hypothetical protein